MEADIEWLLHALGSLYNAQGKLAQAEEMYMRALKGYEKALGADHTSTLDTVNNLGLLYRDQGKLAQAEEMYMRALKGREKALGADHTSTLGTVNNLGLLYADQGKMQEAEAMYTRALEGYRNVEGNHEADVEYLQEQLEALRIGGGVPNSHLKGELRSQTDKDFADLAG
ncbi:hypothetical protein LTR85_000999 [Meristemomyces frigidus]|nr:hypothetical protein LTR85_000999 [Meristemomyces frigidus]